MAEPLEQEEKPEDARRLVAGELTQVPPGWYELETGPDTVRLVFVSSDQPKALPGEMQGEELT